ncbi:MAG: hypothetical protein ACK52K_12285 [Alphaproteobacteria bacterium]
MSAPEHGADPFGEPIHRYSRREAIEDGTLVDVTGEAKRADLPRSADRCSFRLHLPVDGQRQQLPELVVHIGPGDSGEPVVTISYPEDF